MIKKSLKVLYKIPVSKRNRAHQYRGMSVFAGGTGEARALHHKPTLPLLSANPSRRFRPDPAHRARAIEKGDDEVDSRSHELEELRWRPLPKARGKAWASQRVPRGSWQMLRALPGEPGAGRR